MQKFESKQLDEIAELLMSARADIVVNKNFAAAVEAINVALDEIAVKQQPAISGQLTAKRFRQD